MARNKSHDGVLESLVKLAATNRLVSLSYRKPGEDLTTDRIVEPYRLQESSGNLMVQAWQLKPEVGDRLKWRNFRLDRIVRLADGGCTFVPRCPVTVHLGEVGAFEWGHEPAQTLGPAAEYFSYIESAMLDGQISSAELIRARQLGVGLSEEVLRGVHAQILRNILDEVLMDGCVSEKEARYINNVRVFLTKLGWAP